MLPRSIRFRNGCIVVCLKELNNCYNEIESKYSNHDFDDDFTKYITPKNIQNMDVLSITNLITGQYESEQMRNDILSNIAPSTFIHFN